MKKLTKEAKEALEKQWAQQDKETAALMARGEELHVLALAANIDFSEHRDWLLEEAVYGYGTSEDQEDAIRELEEILRNAGYPVTTNVPKG